MTSPRPLFALTLCAAAAATLAPLAAHAQSSVAVYGALSADMVSASNVYSSGSATRYRALDGGSWSPSRIGFRGTEDLGGGLTALFGIESGLSPDTGTASGTFWNRGTTVGLRGDFGTVTIGRQWNLNDDLLGDYFIFGGYAAFRYSEFNWLSDLTNNSLKYYTPKIGGLQIGLLYSLGEQAGSSSAGRTVELSATYTAGPLSLALTHHDAKSTTTSASDKLTSAGVNYRVGDFRARLGYAVSDSQASGLPKATTYDLGADWFGLTNTRISLDYVARDQKSTGNDSAFVRLVGDYSLSKRTGITANLIRLTNDGTASERFYGTGAAGASQTVVTLGLRHNF